MGRAEDGKVQNFLGKKPLWVMTEFGFDFCEWMSLNMLKSQYWGNSAGKVCGRAVKWLLRRLLSESYLEPQILLPTQLPSNVFPGKKQMMASVNLSLHHSHRSPTLNSRILTSSRLCLSCYRHLESEPVDRRSLFIRLFHSNRMKINKCI